MSPDEYRLKVDLRKTFLTFKGFIKNPYLRTYIWILLGQSIGFGAIESIFRYILVKRGYSKEEFTLVTGYLTPLTIVGSAIAVNIFENINPIIIYRRNLQQQIMN